jgi:hypothetical protein
MCRAFAFLMMNVRIHLNPEHFQVKTFVPVHLNVIHAYDRLGFQHTSLPYQVPVFLHQRVERVDRLKLPYVPHLLSYLLLLLLLLFLLLYEAARFQLCHDLL